MRGSIGQKITAGTALKSAQIPPNYSVSSLVQIPHKKSQKNLFGSITVALYWHSPRAQTNMRSIAEIETELLLKNLVHDLRQPLSTIETSTYYLNLLLG